MIDFSDCDITEVYSENRLEISLRIIHRVVDILEACDYT